MEQIALAFETAVCLIRAHPQDTVTWNDGNTFAGFTALLINCLQNVEGSWLIWKATGDKLEGTAPKCTFLPLVSSS